MIAVLFAALLVSVHWLGSWAASPVDAGGQSLRDQTVRMIVHLSAGGSAVRIRLSNTFGTQPLRIGRAAVGNAEGMHVATFGGSEAATIPAGAELYSDPVRIHVKPESNLTVSIYLPQTTGPSTWHIDTLQDAFVASGDRATDTSNAAYAKFEPSWYFLDGVDVLSPESGAVVAFGDSITEGYRSTQNANRRWPDVLATRLQQLPAAKRLAVLNEGIGGNRLLLDGNQYGVNALARLDRDVIAQTGVRDVIVLLGINDIQQPPHVTSPAPLIAALRQIAARLHAKHLRVIGGTITPFGGWGTYTPQREQIREAVNGFVRTSGAFDGVVDFDAAVRDPNDAHRLLPAYDSGDHLHPNDAGYRVMGRAVSLAELR